VRQRLNYELGIIHQMGFDTYFLIVWDLCRYAREQGIWYNARGSAAGSIVAYALDITLVDPIEHVTQKSGCLMGRAQCSEESPCALHTRWARVREEYLKLLTETTIADLAERHEIPVTLTL
jgi:DNA-binding IscR family transcriptional regulator